MNTTKKTETMLKEYESRLKRVLKTYEEGNYTFDEAYNEINKTANDFSNLINLGYLYGLLSEKEFFNIDASDLCIKYRNKLRECVCNCLFI